MKYKKISPTLFVTVALSLIFFSSCANFSGAPRGWYPFSLPEQLDISSAANTGSLVLDPPAGKHGFLRSEHGHFVFEDGTPAKFWGTNLSFSACFPDREKAEILAEYLAFFGFNAVRFHHMDSFFEPNGIFEDPLPGSDDPQKKRTGILSPRQLERLDYLVYQLKKRGIYSDFNLLVSRRFTLADGVIQADRLKPGAKPASMFDPRLIELQKSYARDLLSHYNPYTGLRYADDPAVALVEIVNENSIFSSRLAQLPPYYAEMINNTWDDFPKGSYKSYEEARTAFAVFLEKKYFDDMVGFLKRDCSVKVPITGIGGYHVPETLKSMESCDYIDTHAYWDHPEFPRTKWDRSDFTYHSRPAISGRGDLLTEEILSRMPSPGGKPYTVSEWSHSYPNPFAYETPVIMAYSAVRNGWDGVFQYAFSQDLESYPGAGNIANWFDISCNPQQLLLSAAGSVLMHAGEKGLSGRFEEGAFIVDSPMLKGAAGRLKGREFSFDGFSFTSMKDGAVFIYPSGSGPVKNSERFILIASGRVRNSGVREKGAYLWGKAPVLMEEMDIKLSFPGKGKKEVFVLDESGKKKNKLKGRLSGDGTLFFTSSGSRSPWFEVIIEK